MDTAPRYGLVFNKDKCKKRQKQIKYNGLICNDKGSPDPEKCDRIKSKPKPTNQELQQIPRHDSIPKPFHAKTAPPPGHYLKNIWIINGMKHMKKLFQKF